MQFIIALGFMFLALMLSTVLAVVLKRTVGKPLSTKHPRLFAYLQVVLAPIFLFVSSAVILILVLFSYNNDPNIKILMYSALATSFLFMSIYVAIGLVAIPMFIKKKND